MAEESLVEGLLPLIGFRPVPGTLNLELDRPFDRSLATRHLTGDDLPPGWAEATGQAGYWLAPMVAGGRHRVIAFQADEPDYPANQVELIAAVHLRDALELRDGDSLWMAPLGRLETPPVLDVPRPAAGERWIAGAFVHDGAGRILMQRRSPDRGLFPGAWDVVGGHVEEDETILDCLRREVTEETGWELQRIVAELGTVRYTGDDGGDRLEADYLVEVSGDLWAPRIERSLHDDPRWVTENEAMALLDGAHTSDALLRPVMQAAFAALRMQR